MTETDSTLVHVDAVLETAGSLRAATGRLERLATGLSGETYGCPHRQRRLDFNGALLESLRDLAGCLEQKPESWRTHQSPVSRAKGGDHAPAAHYWQYMTALAERFVESGEQAFALDLDGTAFDLLAMTQDAMAWVYLDAYPDQGKPWLLGLRDDQAAIH